MKADNQVPIWVILSDKEIKRVKAFAKKVRENNRKKIRNRETFIIGNKPEAHYNDHGFIAEFAFEKASGSKGDWTIGVRKGGADGVMKDGTRYDVKSTEVPDGHLINSKDNEDVDIFVFCVVSKNLAITKIYGYAWRKEFISKKYYKKWYGKWTYVMRQDQLQHFKSSGSTILSLYRDEENEQTIQRTKQV